MKGGEKMQNAIIVVLGFILLDIITGIMKAIYNGTFNSTTMREGGWHKAAEILALFVACFAEYSQAIFDYGLSIPFVNVVCVYLSAMELISILENVCEMNPQLSKLFEPYLEKLKGGK